MIKKSRKFHRTRHPQRVSRVPANAELKVLRKLVSITTSAGFPVPSTFFSALRTNDLDRILESAADWGLQKYNPGLDSNVDSFAVRHLITSLLRKFDDSASSELLAAKAVESVQACEKLNRLYNKDGYKRLYSAGSLSPVLQRAQRVIESIVGLPTLDELFEECRHGPGSSTSHSFKEASSYFKYERLPYRVTKRGFGYAKSVIQSDQRWMSYLEIRFREEFNLEAWTIINWPFFWNWVLTIHEPNRITTVPKDVSKRRPIAIENSMNIYLQLGVEGFLRRRLRRWGIDLNDQTLNQRLALEGSTDRSYLRPATIDLSNASDTISLRICKILLPEWLYALLGDIRAHSGVLPDGRILRYAKMSSMGNGATFALESLIFFAVAFSVTEKYLGESPRGHVSVFGDDIVVPEDCSSETIHLLEACGFIPNRHKSFVAGPFKESCGYDCFKGTIVTPVYLRRPLRTDSDIYSLRNRLFRWFSIHLPEVDFQPLDDLMLPWCRRRLYGPLSDDEFDTYIHSPSKGRFVDSMYRFESLQHYIRKRTTGSSSLKSDHDYNSVSYRSERNLHLRKLMHDLRPIRPVPFTQDLSNGGSRFDIYQREKIRTRKISRRTSYWRDEYMSS
jgi:hypothetical protein